jgi:hypothetical protein
VSDQRVVVQADGRGEESPRTIVGPRQQGAPDAVVKAMAGRAGTDVAARGQDKHLHHTSVLGGLHVDYRRAA